MKNCLIKKTLNGIEKDQIITINRVSLENATDSLPPYYIKNKDGKYKIYAYCPQCQNPIRIIGLYKKSEQKALDIENTAFGKHTNEKDCQLQKSPLYSYKACPLYKPREYNQNEKRGRETILDKTIKERLVKDFDKIVYFLTKTTGIAYGKGLLEKMILSYNGADGWNYVGATLENIPWIFVYMSFNQNLYGQFFSNTGENNFIFEELRKKKYKAVLETNGNFTRFAGFEDKSLQLKHFYTNHKSCPKDGVLNESIEMVVHIDGKDGYTKEILRKKSFLITIISTI